MVWTDDSRTQYRGFEVYTSLVSFGASGWRARYSIASKADGPHGGEIVVRGEVQASSNRVDQVLATARAAAYRWIDCSLSGVT